VNNPVLKTDAVYSEDLLLLMFHEEVYFTVIYIQAHGVTGAG